MVDCRFSSHDFTPSQDDNVPWSQHSIEFAWVRKLNMFCFFVIKSAFVYLSKGHYEAS